MQINWNWGQRDDVIRTCLQMGNATEKKSNAYPTILTMQLKTDTVAIHIV